MKPVESAAGVAEESEVSEGFAVGAIHDPHHVVHDVRNVYKRLFRPREREAPGGSPIQGIGRDRELSHELSVLGEYLHTICASIGSVNETVIRDR